MKDPGRDLRVELGAQPRAHSTFLFLFSVGTVKAVKALSALRSESSMNLNYEGKPNGS